jgi:hypothetical protein
MEADISTLLNPDILTLQRHTPSNSLTWLLTQPKMCRRCVEEWRAQCYCSGLQLEDDYEKNSTRVGE